MNLQEIITAKVPGAVYTEAGDGMFTIPVEQFHDLARYLHDDPALRFDFLRSLTGMDWGEEGLGAVYHLESTATGENVVLKVLTPSREQCGLPTVSDIWKGAELNEREVFDFFGIGFINHPDMRRLYLRDDWVGYPLRKDYDQSGETNPLRMTNEVAHDSSPSYELQPDGSIIPHLYAAGEVAGTGMYGTQYPTCGTSIGGALFYGRIAGRVAMDLKML